MRQTAELAAEREADALRRFRIVRLLVPIAVIFFGVQAAVMFSIGTTLAGIALSVSAGSSAIAGLTFFLLRNVVKAPSWSAESVAPGVDGGTVVVRRLQAPSRDRLRAYDILVDELAVGAVRDGEEVRCAVPAGQHVIRIKLDWSGSRPLDFTVGIGRSVSFLCEPAGSAWSAIGDLLLGRPWVHLRQVDTT